MSMITLYDFPISGNCYKVRLLLSMLGLEYTSIQVDLKGGGSMTPEFKKLNPRGQVPVLVDGNTVIWDSMAILTYLARRYGEQNWLPADIIEQAQVMQWLAVSENECLYGLARARATLIFKRPFNLEMCQQEGLAGLEVMDSHLTKNNWLATESVTIADLACYPYISLADQGEVSVDPYPNVIRWMKDLEALPGWLPITP